MKKKMLLSIVIGLFFTTVFSTIKISANTVEKNYFYNLSEDDIETIDAIFTEDNESVRIYSKAEEDISTQFKDSFRMEYEKGDYSTIQKNMSTNEYSIIIFPSTLKNKKNTKAFPYDRDNSYYWQENTLTNGQFKFKISAKITASQPIGGTVTGYDNNCTVKKVSGGSADFGLDWAFHEKPKVIMNTSVDFVDRVYFKTSTGYYYYNPYKIRLSVTTSTNQPKPVILGKY